MREKNGYKDFYTRVARSRGMNEKSVREWWSAFYEQIITMLFITGRCVLPDIGTFVLVEKEEQVQKQTDADGEEHLYIVPARSYPVFYVDDDFINDINMTGVTKSYRKRLRKGTLTQRDYLRIQRAEKMQVSEVDIARKNEEKAKMDFEKLLKEKKKES